MGDVWSRRRSSSSAAATLSRRPHVRPLGLCCCSCGKESATALLAALLFTVCAHGHEVVAHCDSSWMVWDEGRGFLDTQAAADILAWENSEFSIAASGRIAIVDRDVPSLCCGTMRGLRLRSSGSPLTAVKTAVSRESATCCRRTLAGNWVTPERRNTSTRANANGVENLSTFEFFDRVVDLVPPPQKHRHCYHGAFALNRPAAADRHGAGHREHREAERLACRR